MSEKHVHWADTNREYSPPPRTPSPTWSDSSRADTSSPFTPPSALPSNLPAQQQFSRAHAVLAYHLRIAPLLWDVSLDASTARLNNIALDVLTPAILAQSASEPPVPSMEIQCGGLIWWRPVKITPASADYVTVGDVLDGVHLYLQRGVPGREWEQFALAPGLQRKISASFYARCDRVDALVAAEVGTDVDLGSERELGLRRVDCLLGRDLFAGLTPPHKDSESWWLHLTSRDAT